MSLMRSAALRRTFRPKVTPYFLGCDWKFAHYKRDGHFVRIEIEHGDIWNCWTRRPTDISWPVFECWRGIGALFKRLGRGRWTLLGEMFYPGREASYVKTGLKTGDKTLELEFFAVLECPDYSIDEMAGWDLDMVNDFLLSYDIPAIPFLYREDVGDDLDAAYECAEGIEGFMLKNAHLIGWKKWKKELTIDLIVTGFVEGEGRHAGSVGSLKVSTVEGIEVATVGTGLSDELRRWINDNRETVRGSIVEVKYQYVGTGGRLRHPVFIDWRDDKLAHECVLDQDPKLLLYWNRKHGRK